MSWQPGAALVAAACILIIPLWCVAIPAMPDYPARLASFYLIGGGVRDPAVAQFYHVHWALVPNLASEAVVPLLAKLIGLEPAAKLFLSAAMILWVLGIGLLHRALFGHIGLTPLAGAFFALNANFLWGFFNYYFAAGLALLVFAAWVASENKPGPLRNGGIAFAITLVYLSHIFAAAILLAMIAGFEIARAGLHFRILARKAATVVLIFVPSAILFLIFRPPASDTRLEFHLADTMTDRFDSLIGSGFDQPLHALPVALLILLTLAVLLRRAVIHRAMGLVLAALFAGSLLAPESAMGGWGVHLRLPAVFCAVLFASADLRPGRVLTPFLAVAALVLMSWNAVRLLASWQPYDRQFAEFRQALAALPRGQRLMTVLEGNGNPDLNQPYWHMADLAIIDRGDMTALMFATKGQHIVQLNPPMNRYAATTAQQGSPPGTSELDNLAAGRTGDANIRDIFPYLLRFPCHYDEAVLVYPDGRHTPAPAMLNLLHQGSFFSLYAIGRTGACAP